MQSTSNYIDDANYKPLNNHKLHMLEFEATFITEISEKGNAFTLQILLDQSKVSREKSLGKIKPSSSNFKFFWFFLHQNFHSFYDNIFLSCFLKENIRFICYFLLCNLSHLIFVGKNVSLRLYPIKYFKEYERKEIRKRILLFFQLFHCDNFPNHFPFLSQSRWCLCLCGLFVLKRVGFCESAWNYFQQMCW